MFGQIAPPQITNLKVWLRADSGINLIADNVINWLDVSGNGYIFEQLSAINQPTLVTNTIPYIHFFGNQSLHSTSNFSFNNASIFLVASQASSDVSYGRFLDHDFTSGFWIGRDDASQRMGGGFYESNVPFGNFAPIADDSVFIYSMIRKEDTVKSYLNSTNFPVLSRATSSIQTQSNAITIGSSLNNIYLGNKNIYEVIIYDRNLSTTERQNIESYLHNKYAPPVMLPNDITIINSFCDTVINASPHGYFSNFQWSNGATTPTISVNKSGKYWLNATNIFGKISSDTIFVQFPDFNPPTQNLFCTNDSLRWDTHLPKDQFSFQWQDNSTDSLFTINQTGSYYVKITDAYGCHITTDTISITEDTFSSSASLGPDKNLCAGNPIALITPTVAVNSYLWSTGENTAAITVTNTGQYSVIATNTNNCVAKDTINVTIIGQAPTVNFNASVGCKNAPVAFTDNSVPPSGNSIISWYWNYGDATTLADTSLLQNPFYTYNDTGNYIISLTVQSNVGCKQTLSQNIHVAPAPTASFVVPAVVCQNDTLQFVNQSSNLLGYSMGAYNWNFGDLTTSTLSSPKHIYSNNINYTVKLLVTNNAGCKDSIYKVVSVKAEVKADFSTLYACTNSPTQFQNTSIAPNGATYNWDFGGSFSNVANPSKLYTSSGIYTVKLDVDGGNGCTSSITKLINVYLPPLVSFSASAFCANDTIQIANTTIAQSGVVSSSNWRLNGTSFSTGQTPTLSIASPATYTVLLTTVNSFGCTDSASQALTVYALPNVDFITNPASYYYLDTPVTFSATINNANSYNWNISSIMTSTVSSPVATFTLPGTYTVMLNLIDENGCEGNKTKLMNVAKRYLDLAVMSVKTSKDNAGFISVIADLANYGSVPVTTFDIHYQTNDAGNNKETWNGSINPNSFYTYTFTAKSASKLNDQNNITCVHIESVNTIQDENLLNNDLCNSLNYDNISVENPLPNPTDGDITLPIILTKDMEFTMAIYNAMGQIQMPETTYNGLQGLNFITLPTSSLARGSYIIKVMINDKVFIKKFIRINN